MDYEIKVVQDKLSTYKESHPNLHSFWKEYLNLKIVNLKKTINDLDKAMDHMNNISDLDTISLLTLYCITSLESPR